MSSWRIRCRCAVVLLATVASLNAAGAAHAASPTETLHSQLHAAIAGSTARVAGVHVVVSGLGTVNSHNATTALPPASTQKAYVALAVLQRLTPGARIRTSVRAGAAADAKGVVRGPLVLVGGGDPTLSSAHLTQMAQTLRARGVRTVTGDLFGDDTMFDRLRRAPGWKTSFVPQESGPLSALVVDRNRWRWDAAYVREPVISNVARFRAILAKQGITVRGVNRRGAVPLASRQLAVHDSPTMATLVRTMLKDSDNMTAELLVKRLGATRGIGTTAGGLAVVREHLRRLGVPVGTLADGSGLSSLNRETPAGEVALLRAAENTAVGSVLRQSMSVGCVDGTLKTRFCGTAAARRVQGKTGTLDYVRVLAGYTTTRSGRRVWFSFMLTGCTSGWSCRAAIDRSVVVLASFTG